MNTSTANISNTIREDLTIIDILKNTSVKHGLLFDKFLEKYDKEDLTPEIDFDILDDEEHDKLVIRDYCDINHKSFKKTHATSSSKKTDLIKFNRLEELLPYTTSTPIVSRVSSLRNRGKLKHKAPPDCEVVVVSDTETEEEEENGDQERHFVDDSYKESGNLTTKQAVVMLTPLRESSFAFSQNAKSSLVHSTPMPLVIPETQQEKNQSRRLNEMSAIFRNEERPSSLDLFRKSILNSANKQHQQQQMRIRIAEVKSCKNENERFEFKSSTTVEITTTSTTTTTTTTASSTSRTSTGSNSFARYDPLKSLVQANNRLSLGAPTTTTMVMNNETSNKRKSSSSSSGHVDILKKLLLEKKPDSIHAPRV